MRTVCFIDENGMVATCIREDADVCCETCTYNQFPDHIVPEDRVLIEEHSYSNPHPKRCETCGKNIMDGDESCPIFKNAPKILNNQYELCGEAHVITQYIGCGYWRSR